MNERAPRKGDEIELRLESLDDKGRAVGRVGERTVRVRAGAPGSRVRALVHRRRRKELEATVLEVLEPGDDLVAPRCDHFGSCGGCSFQNVRYERQLAELHGALVRLLEPLLRERTDLEVAPALGCDTPWHYRNKMDFTFGNRRWIEPGEPEGVEADFAVGLHVPGRFDKVLDVDACHIAFEEATPILRTARRLARERGLTAWDVRAHEGLLRHLLLRRSFATGEILAALFTTDEAHDEVDPYLAALLESHPEITTCVQRVTPGSAMVASGGAERVLRGEGSITEHLGGLSFRISTDTFFQTNTRQAEVLWRQVVAAAAVGPDEVVYDLCCGSGPWALAMAAARPGSDAPVFGFELVESAVEDARFNARRNGLTSPVFVAGDLVDVLRPDVLHERDVPPPGLCIVDPPRAGLHPKVLGVLSELRPERIVYVSCNPRSALRDLVQLETDGYRLDVVQPVDLFPHTPHLECVFALRWDPALAASTGER